MLQFCAVPCYFSHMLFWYNPFILTLLTLKQKPRLIAWVKTCTSLPLGWSPLGDFCHSLYKAARMLELLTLVLTTFVPAHKLKTVVGIIWNQTVQILTLSMFQCSSWNSHPPDKRPQVNKVSDRIQEKLTEHHRSNSSGKEDTNIDLTKPYRKFSLS